MRLARQQGLIDAQKQQAREQQERDAGPKRQVTLTVTYQETIKAPVPGVSPAEYRSVKPGDPVLVTSEEWTRLHKLDVIAKTAGESTSANQVVPGFVPAEVYETAAQDVVAKETDVDYAVKGIARHFHAEPDVVRAELERRVGELTAAAAAKSQAGGGNSGSTQK
jgi:hypothetical protein